MKIRLYLLVGILLLSLSVDAHPRLHSFFLFRNKSFKKVLHHIPPSLRCVIDSAANYRTQIIFTEIKNRGTKKPKLITYKFQPNKKYFYPASMVKLPIAMLTLQKLQQLHISPTAHLVLSAKDYCGLKNQTEVKNGLTFEEYIARMMVVSNNFAFNPLYDFLGRDEINRQLHQSGYPSAKIVQRFSGACDTTANSKSVSFKVTDDSGKILYTEDEKTFQRMEKTKGDMAVGLRYYNADDVLINVPKTFEAANLISLDDLHRLVLQLACPGTFVPQIQLDSASQHLLLKYMTMLPSESRNPQYDRNNYPDNFGKYFFYGDGKTKPDGSLQISNKVGMAYGFLTDCAIITDKKTNKRFVLSATVFVDRDGTLNDSKYAYNELGLPFLSELGKLMLSVAH